MDQADNIQYMPRMSQLRIHTLSLLLSSVVLFFSSFSVIATILPPPSRTFLLLHPTAVDKVKHIEHAPSMIPFL